jgi:hypothetical protein
VINYEFGDPLSDSGLYVCIYYVLYCIFTLKCTNQISSISQVWEVRLNNKTVLDFRIVWRGKFTSLGVKTRLRLSTTKHRLKARQGKAISNLESGSL